MKLIDRLLNQKEPEKKHRLVERLEAGQEDYAPSRPQFITTPRNIRREPLPSIPFLPITPPTGEFFAQQQEEARANTRIVKDYFRKTKANPRDILRATQGQDLDFILNTVSKDPISFGQPIHELVGREHRVRQEMVELKKETPRTQNIMYAVENFGNFFNINEYLDRKGLNPFTKGQYTIALEAINRLIAERPLSASTLTLQIGTQVPKVLLEFTALPDVGSKIKALEKTPRLRMMLLSALKLGTRQAVQAPESAETLAERATKVGTAGAMGAGVGATGAFVPSTLVRAPLNIAGFSLLTKAMGGSNEDVIETAATIGAFEAFGLLKKGEATLGRKYRQSLEKKALNSRVLKIKSGLTDKGIDISQVPEHALETLVKSANKYEWWKNQYNQGKITLDVYNQRIEPEVGAIRNILGAIARSQAEPAGTPGRAEPTASKKLSEALQRTVKVSKPIADLAAQKRAEGWPVAKIDQEIITKSKAFGDQRVLDDIAEFDQYEKERLQKIYEPERVAVQPPTEAEKPPGLPQDAGKAAEATQPTSPGIIFAEFTKPLGSFGMEIKADGTVWLTQEHAHKDPRIKATVLREVMQLTQDEAAEYKAAETLPNRERYSIQQRIFKQAQKRYQASAPIGKKYPQTPEDAQRASRIFQMYLETGNEKILEDLPPGAEIKIKPEDNSIALAKGLGTEEQRAEFKKNFINAIGGTELGELDYKELVAEGIAYQKVWGKTDPLPEGILRYIGLAKQAPAEAGVTAPFEIQDWAKQFHQDISFNKDLEWDYSHRAKAGIEQIFIGTKGLSANDIKLVTLHEIGHNVSDAEGTFHPEIKDEKLQTEVDATEWALRKAIEQGIDISNAEKLFTKKIVDLAKQAPAVSEQIEPPEQLPPEQPPAGPPAGTSEQPPGQEPSGKPFVQRVLERTQEIFEHPEAKTEIETLSEDVAGLLKKQKILSKKEFEEIEAEKKKERGRRTAVMAGAVEQMKKRGVPPSEYQKSIGAMKGSLYVKQRWPSIRNQKPATEWEKLHEHIWNLPDWRLQLFDKQTTAAALDKLLDGYYLTKDEIIHISDVFPQLGQEALKRRPPITRGMDAFLSWIGLPKATIAGIFDISAVGHQLAPLWFGYPNLFTKAEKESIKILFRKSSAEYTDSLEKAMEEDPYYWYAKKMGIEITKPGSKAVSREQLEEKFPTRLVSKVPLVGHLSRRTEAAFADISTLMRVGALWLAEDTASEAGRPLSETAKVRVGKTINALSGRLGLPKELAWLSQLMSTVMFSPRTVGGRFAAPTKIGSRTPEARRIGARAFSRMTAFAVTIAILAKLAHRKIKDIDSEFHPLSTYFLRFKYKNTYFDPTFGYGRIITAVARFALAKTLTQAGEVKPIDRKGALTQYAKTKKSPALGIASDIWTRENFIGRKAFLPPQGTIGELLKKYKVPPPVGIGAKFFYDHFAPIPVQDVVDAWNADGVLQGLIALPFSLQGSAITSYEPTASTQLTIKQNELAQKAHKKKWDDLLPREQKEFQSQLEDLQVKVGQEKALYPLPDFLSVENKKSTAKLYGVLDENTKSKLYDIGITDVGHVSRHWGDYELNNERYARYEKIAGVLIGYHIDRTVKSSRFTDKDVPPSEKREKVKEVVEKAKERARKFVEDEIKTGKKIFDETEYR